MVESGKGGIPFSSGKKPREDWLPHLSEIDFLQMELVHSGAFIRIVYDLKRPNCDITWTIKQRKACLSETGDQYLHSVRSYQVHIGLLFVFTSLHVMK